jgi:hypothetical protein
MTSGELHAWRRFQEDRKLCPAVGQLAFRDTKQGWVVKRLGGVRELGPGENSSAPWSKRFSAIS